LLGEGGRTCVRRSVIDALFVAGRWFGRVTFFPKIYEE